MTVPTPPGLPSTPWPLDGTGTPARVPVPIRAERPGHLAWLSGWGIGSAPVRDERGCIVAAQVTDGDLPRLWGDLVRAFPTLGLWPVLTSERDVPWLGGELAGPQPMDTDALTVLRTAAGRSDDELAALAPASPSRPVELTPPAFDDVAGLIITPVVRPCDVPARLGWYGAVNHDLSGADVSAVLASWEDRYGAVLVSLTLDVASLQVTSPPTDRTAAHALALEHDAFCPDNVDQGTGTLEAYLPAVMDREWLFWWD